MKTQNQTLLPEINNFCKALEKEFHLIPKERKEKLLSLSTYISRKFDENKVPKCVVICTHNSRRSHIGQLWISIGRDFYQLPQIHSFSGGTEATAFNIRAVESMRRIGLQISSKHKSSVNPTYEIKWKEEMQPYKALSKRFDNPRNPKDNFAAIMVCSQADEGCPIVFGSDFRISLPYDDPKDFDNTENEQKKYNERVKHIGREMLFALSQIEKRKSN